jgi:hypothetical protein
MSNLDGINFYGDPSTSEILIKNLISFIDYGLLEMGAYQNIPKDKTNYQNIDISALKSVSATGFGSYKTWRGLSNNWVFESGVTLKFAGGTAPLVPTGIYFNNTFYPTGSNITGTGYYIDFARGQVVFANPVPSNSLVQVPRAERAVHIYPTDSNEFRKVTDGWLTTSATGTYDSNVAKAYLPAIFIDVRSFETVRGIELGSRGKSTQAEINFEIFSQNGYELNKLIDVLYMLETKTMVLYDIKNSPTPLNYRGELVRPDVNYKYLISTYPLSEARFDEEAFTYKVPNSEAPLFRGRVTIPLRIDVSPI